MKHLGELFTAEQFEILIKSELDSLLKAKKDTTTSMLKPEFYSYDEENAALTIKFPVLKWELNGNEVMHGGNIASAFDVGLGIFANVASNNRFAPTTNLSINYIKPVHFGDSLLVTAKLTSVGNKLITLSGEGRLESNGKIAATAMATYTIAAKLPNEK